jgi:hypothetical protein
VQQFDAQRLAVVGGDGVVARFPGVLCVAAADEPAALRPLLDIIRAAAGADPGRALARKLAAWLAGCIEDAPLGGLRFGTVGAAGEGLAVFLFGGVSAVVPEAGATLSGTESAAWLDRLLPRSTGPVVLTIGGVAIPSELSDGVSDLRFGVVPGSAAVLLDTAEPAEVPAPIRAQAAVTEPVPHRGIAGDVTELAPALSTETPVLRVPRRTEPILGVAVTEPIRPPLEVGSSAAPGRPPSVDSAPDVPQARGHLCSRGHLNDPRSHFCVLCGIRMNERTGALVLGPRPPLGLLVFDDGATYTVDAEYLVGRMPELDERVRSGALRSIVVEDRSGSVSRVHAEVRVNGWDVLVVDTGSRNGTYLAVPGERCWSPLVPRQGKRLVPGTRVRLGARTFIFESPSGVR